MDEATVLSHEIHDDDIRCDVCEAIEDYGGVGELLEAIRLDERLHAIAKYRPPLALRLAARRWPEWEWLFYLPPSERHFYVRGPNAEYHRQLVWFGFPRGVWARMTGDA